MFRIIAVSDGFQHFASGIDELKKRMPDLQIKCVKAEKSTDSIRIISRETDRIIELIEKEKLSIIYLDIGAKTYSTEDFGKYIEKISMQHPKFAFVIGGAYGVDMARLSKYCISTISLSPMTFPHSLALLILIEQLYRITMIKKGSGYHHG